MSNRVSAHVRGSPTPPQQSDAFFHIQNAVDYKGINDLLLEQLSLIRNAGLLEISKS